MQMAGIEESFEDCGGMLQSDDIRTGFISGATFRNKPVQYSVVDGLAVFEGCIVLGRADEMDEIAQNVQSNQAGEDAGGEIAHGIGITGSQCRWPGGLMPNEIDPALPNKNRVTGATIHEIGHAFGLWHEQSRQDRDRFVRILWQNIQAGREHNFNQHISDGDDIGAYDYASIMHYPTWGFSKNGQPTIETIPPGIPIGQRSVMSPGDIAVIHSMYQLWHYNVPAPPTGSQTSSWRFATPGRMAVPSTFISRAT
jgi:hypothetical protein